jgi:general secretion pathway protein A
MYHERFGLNRSPFSIEPDPDFLWLGEKHLEGLSVLRYGILENKGFLLLTGDAGTGKTVLIRSLLTSLTGDVTVATIPDPSLTLLDFFNVLSSELGMAPTIDSKVDFLIQFKKFVHRVYGSQKRLLVIIDEAQRLTNELIDEIRVLSNIDHDNRKLINIFFVGQIEFNQIIGDPCNRALRQRITLSYHLAPLDHDDTAAYIRHRLQVAGTEKELFTPAAVHEIFKITKGTPRLINILCDRALITGYIRDLNRVSPEMILECARELGMASGAEVADRKKAPQIETPPATRERAVQTKAITQPFSRRGQWLSAAGVGAAAVVAVGVFFTQISEHRRVQEPASTERQGSETHLALTADPKDSSPAEPLRVSDRRQPQNLRERGAEWTSEGVESKGRRFLFFFKPSSADLEDSSYETLRQVSDFLTANPKSDVTLTTRSAKVDTPGLSAKLLELRANSIRSVLVAQPKFKGKITVIHPSVQTVVADHELADAGFSAPWAEIRVEPGVNRRVID